MKEKEGSGKTIGVVLGSIGDLFQSHVWPGVVDAARERGLQVILYSGKIPETPFTSQRELGVVYGFPSRERLDGIILFSSSLFNFVTEEEFRRGVDRYGDIPLVSLSRVAEGRPSVLVDNYAGMSALVRHFVRDHGFTRIAFIRGPEGSREAEERFAAYRDALEEAGIPYDESLVVQGYFMPEGGMKAARELLDARKAHFQAILGANDGSLLGALNYMRNRWISIPEDLAAGGFDDVDDARIQAPPLTTVDQSLYTLGRTSCEILADMLAGKEVPEITRVPTRLVIRRSCGCVGSGRILDGRNRNVPLEGILLPSPPPEEDVEYLRLFRLLAPPLAAQAEGFPPEVTFWETFVAIMDNSPFDPVETKRIQRVLKNLASWAASLPRDAQERVSESLESVRFLLREHVGRSGNWSRYSNELSFIRTLSGSLPTALSLPAIFSILETSLTELGIDFCLLSEPDGDCTADGIFADPPEMSRLVFAWRDGKRLTIPDEGIPFMSRTLAPEGYFPKGAGAVNVVMPLMHGDEYQGFMLCGYPAAGGIILSLDFLHEQLSAAVKASRMVDDLKNAQNRLMQTEKMASLGELTAGIAHELKNPLNFVNNFAEGIGEYLGEIEGALPKEGEKVTRDWLAGMKKSLEDLRTASQSIERHGKKANHIIRSMLNQARGDTGRLERTQVEPLLRDSVVLAWQSFKIQYPDVPVAIEETYEEGIPELLANPSLLNRVFINLLTNALYALQLRSRAEAGFAAKLSVTARPGRGGIEILVTDNGIGIRDDIKNKLFQPFFTTKPNNEGTGLGLKICRDIVVDGHNGTIDVESRPLDFTTFKVFLPYHSQ